MVAAEYEEPYPHRRKKSKVWIVLLLVIGIPVTLVLGIVTLGVLFYATAKDLPITPADRSVLPTAAYLSDWFEDFDPTAGTETLTKKRFLDRSIDLDYTYEDADDADPFVYITCTVTVDTKPSDARITYEAGSAGSSIGLGITGVTRQERNDLFSWGERSRCGILVGELDQPVGNQFICLSGTKTFEWLVVGVYWDDGEALAEVLEPLLSRLATWAP